MSELDPTAAWSKPVTLRGRHVLLEPLRAAHADGRGLAFHDGSEVIRLFGRLGKDGITFFRVDH